MIISYISGVTILSQHVHAIRRGEIRLLLFFLGSQYDRTFLEGVKDLSTDIDHLTGSHCLAIAFMPPPDANELSHFNSIDGAWRNTFADDSVQLRQYVDAMTRNTYELADYLGVPLQDLPAIAFISADEPEKYALLRMGGRSLSEVYPTIRQLLYEWYLSNKRTIDAYRLSRLAPHDAALPQDIRAAIEGAIREHVVPSVIAAFEDLLAQYPDLRTTKLPKWLKSLRRHPRNPQPLVDFLHRLKLEIRLNEHVLGSTLFAREYARLCEHYAVDVITRAANTSAVDALKPFPLERVAALDRYARLKSMTKSVNVKGIVDIIAGILKIVGLGAA